MEVIKENRISCGYNILKYSARLSVPFLWIIFFYEWKIFKKIFSPESFQKNIRNEFKT